MGDCFECGSPADHDHHVVPRSLGGTRTIPLCGMCHGKVHDHEGLTSTSALTREAMRRKREWREYTGGHTPYGWRLAPDGVRLEADEAEQETIRMAREASTAGLSLRAIGAALADRGLLPRSGRWHAETVKATLSAELAG